MVDCLTPYLVFDGDCADAVAFYEEVFGGKSQIMRAGDAPPNPAFSLPEAKRDMVIHAEIVKGEQILMIMSDNLMGAPYTVGTNIGFTLQFNTERETRKLFEALSAGGKVEMEPQVTFFSPLFAKFTDRFGVGWQLRTRPAEERKQTK